MPSNSRLIWTDPDVKEATVPTAALMPLSRNNTATICKAAGILRSLFMEGGELPNLTWLDHTMEDHFF
jgi:hypothetical protein